MWLRKKFYKVRTSTISTKYTHTKMADTLCIRVCLVHFFERNSRNLWALAFACYDAKQLLKIDNQLPDVLEAHLWTFGRELVALLSEFVNHVCMATPPILMRKPSRFQSGLLDSSRNQAVHFSKCSDFSECNSRKDIFGSDTIMLPIIYHEYNRTLLSKPN